MNLTITQHSVLDGRELAKIQMRLETDVVYNCTVPDGVVLIYRDYRPKSFDCEKLVF